MVGNEGGVAARCAAAGPAIAIDVATAVVAKAALSGVAVVNRTTVIIVIAAVRLAPSIYYFNHTYFIIEVLLNGVTLAAATATATYAFTAGSL